MDKVVLSIVEQLSKVIGKIAPEVWRIMLQQQFSEAIMYSIYSFICLSAIIVGSIVISKCIKHLGEDASFGLFLAMLSVVGASFVGFLMSIQDFVYHLINPEYQAIMDLISLGKK